MQAGGQGTKTAEGAAAPSRRHGFRLLERLFAVQELGVLVAGLVIGAVFAFLSPEFLTLASAGSILASAVQFGIVGLGITILMIAGEFDLSVGAVFVLTSYLMAMAYQAGWPLPAACPLPAPLSDRFPESAATCVSPFFFAPS